ncbi:DUF4229 domain-containing protein [Haloglycomyces albus]|uniref:DUF4229 domain-containing protein n=1 Tax=Haloglycomyces albus TaxID=526067 RepID=UPI00046CAA19|nr:DUF4229 domain-containing protein [Haloglycomyces albus]
MNPTLTYIGARLGLFALFAIPLLFIIEDVFLALVIAVVASMGLSLFALRRLRENMITSIDTTVKERKEQKAKLRKELEGDD